MAQLNANFASGNVDSSEAFVQRCENDGMEYLNSLWSSNSLLSGNLSNSATMDISWPTQQNCDADQNIQSPASLTESRLQTHPFSLNQMLMKPSIDANANIPQEQNAQQLIPRQGNNQLPDHQPQLRALLQPHRTQIIESLPQFSGVQAQQSERQFRHRLQRRASRPVSSRNDVTCTQWIQLLYTRKNRPQGNSINFWRKLVSDFYSPCAKERWCFSSYKNIGQEAIGILSREAVGQWRCGLCGAGPGKGFEASFEILPRLWKIKFESGVREELLSLGSPKEYRLPSGVMLEYDKAVQHSVYKQFRVVHEAKLRVLFGPDLKIKSWEFCASHHDAYFLRRLIAPQVNQLISTTQEYQGVLTEGISENNISMEKLVASSNMIANMGHQVTSNLELPTVDQLGFSTRYVRCMQISEVLDIMRDLMTFNLDQNIGPIDSMRAYCHQCTGKECHGRSVEIEGQENAQEISTQNVLTNGNSFICRNIDLPNQFNDGSIGGRSTDLELLEESMLNPKTFVMKPDQSHLMDNANHRSMSSQFWGQQSPNSRLFHHPVFTGLLSPLPSKMATKNIQQQMKEQTCCETRENIFSGSPTGARATNIMSNGRALGRVNSFCSVRGDAETSAHNSDSLNVVSSNLGIITETAMKILPPPEGMHPWTTTVHQKCCLDRR